MLFQQCDAMMYLMENNHFSHVQIALRLLLLILCLNGCASGPTPKTEQSDTAAAISRSLDTSAEASEVGTRR
jgi:hypothetical protein